MHTRHLVRSTLLLSLCCATLTLADDASSGSRVEPRLRVELRSPLLESTSRVEPFSLQDALHRVIDRSSGSVFAVTAFYAPGPGELFQKSLAPALFAKVADRIERSCGTAFAIDGDGYLLTNEHVVSGARSVWVTTDAGAVLPAFVVGSDPRGDLAVLKIPVNTTPLPMTSVRSAERGDLVVAIGNPGGLSLSGQMAASVGTVSAVGRSLPTLSAREHRFYGDLLQITTPITTGSSGGPLLDLSGNAIGVICAVVPNTPADQNIGFAIALSPSVIEKVQQLRRGEEVVYGYIGVNVSAAADESAGTLLTGARVDHIDAGTPAAGVLEVGDIVLRFDGKAISSDVDFIRLAGRCGVDREVPLSIFRAGQTIDLTIRPRRRQLPIEPVVATNQRLEWAGVTFARQEGGITVAEILAGAETPLQPGQIITHVNGTMIDSIESLLAILHRQAGDELEIEVSPGTAESGE